MAPLEDISLEELHEVLAEVEGSKATQRVMVAINYKHEEEVTQKEIAERYGISPATVREWLKRVEKVKGRPPNEVLCDGRQSDSSHNDSNTRTLSPAITLTREQKEQRRLAAAEELQAGELSQVDIAERHGVSQGVVSKWKSTLEEEGIEGLKSTNNEGNQGPAPLLDEEELGRLEEILSEGAESYGFTGQIWTGKRVAKVIKDEFDISITDRTATRYLHRLGWSNKKPRREPFERDPEGVKQFRNEEWPKIRDTAKQESQVVVFVDETKFRLVPNFLSTWAPEGEEATVESRSTFEFIAVVGALTYTPEIQEFGLQYDTQRYNFNTESILPFLRDVTRSSSQNPVFLLDNWKPHKNAIAELHEEYAETPTNIEAEYFPAYASDLNPADRVWDLAKNTELPNYAPKSLDELEEKVVSAFENIRTDERKLRYCVKDAELEIEA